jgi:hypothetical protein
MNVTRTQKQTFMMFVFPPSKGLMLLYYIVFIVKDLEAKVFFIIFVFLALNCENEHLCVN